MKSTRLLNDYAMTADQMPEHVKIPDLQRLEFRRNWNKKLDCISYTTFRMANPGRYQVGRKFGIYLNRKHHHDAEIMLVKTVILSQVNEWVARIDTGYSLEKFVEIVHNMYKNKPINFETQKWNLILLRKLNYTDAKL